jgi:hypothetical protein
VCRFCHGLAGQVARAELAAWSEHGRRAFVRGRNH